MIFGLIIILNALASKKLIVLAEAMLIIGSIIFGICALWAKPSFLNRSEDVLKVTVSFWGSGSICIHLASGWSLFCCLWAGVVFVARGVLAGHYFWQQGHAELDLR